jgi:hypothetical protein
MREMLKYDSQDYTGKNNQAYTKKDIDEESV